MLSLASKLTNQLNSDEASMLGRYNSLPSHHVN